MISTTQRFAAPAHRFHWPSFRLAWIKRKRRQTTMDLIHSSPHMLRDIGLGEGHLISRGR